MKNSALRLVDYKSFRILPTDTVTAALRFFAPTIVLHHPHTTDSPRIWLGAIHQLRHKLPSVTRFISGINIYNDGNPPRGQWDDVLKFTTFGPSVIEVKLA